MWYCALTVQVHNWRCRRCTFNTDKGIAAKAKCTQVSSPALFVLKGGKPGEQPADALSAACYALQTRQSPCHLQTDVQHAALAISSRPQLIACGL